MRNGSLMLRIAPVFSSALLCAAECCSATPPVVAYTDITSGPNVGGEDNNGAYLTLFGSGFGATQGASTVSINGVSVAAVKQWGNHRITIQPGPSVSSGPIRVTVDGVTSNIDQLFTVRSGRIFFVSLAGSDSGGVAGDIAKPYRSASTVFDTLAQPGDQIVMRGGSWTDNYATYNSFFSFVHKGGSAFDTFVLMGYPGETVQIERPPGSLGMHAYDTTGGFTISNFHVNMNGGSTCVGWPPSTSPTGTVQYVRIVNTELYGMLEDGGGSACIEGRGKHIKVLGNLIHDNLGNKLYHGIYFDNNDSTGTSDIEIAYNSVYNQTGGRGIQIYNAGVSGISNVSVHHNLVHDIALDGILFGDSTQGGMIAYDNVVYNTAVKARQNDGVGGGCIRFNNPGLVAQVFNNTLANCASDGNSDSAALRFEAASTIAFVNNIVSSSGGSGYYTGAPSAAVFSGSSNNLWYGSGTAPSWSGTASMGANPGFVSASTGNYRLSATSPAIDAGSSIVSSIVTTDAASRPRPRGRAYDIGAFENDGTLLPVPQQVQIRMKP